MIAIEHVLRAGRPALRIGTVLDVDGDSGRAQVRLASGVEIWADNTVGATEGEAVVVSGRAPAVILQKAAGFLPAASTIETV